MPKRITLDDIEDTPTSRRREGTLCCWPKCRKDTAYETPLCEAHISITHRIQIDIWSGNPALYKVRAQIVDHRDDPQPVKDPVQGTIYYLRSGGFIKIGWASDLTKRMKAYPPDSVLLATQPGTRSDESSVHRKFAVHRTHGREWFAMVPSLMAHIDRVKTEHGEPGPLSFGAKPVSVPQPRPKSYVGGNYRGNGLVGERRI